MPNYLLTFHGALDMPEDPAEQEQAMAAWGAWYADIGAGLVDGGAPISHSAGVGPDGPTDAPATLSGYTIVSAPDLAAATKIAEGSPVLAGGHTVQVSECIDMG
ncbi:MAG: hypothetical protein HKN26_14245 [Acidimicrobiales bacterium]|nr:hypothetical protein [Acidimicrobiales bacterium]